MSPSGKSLSQPTTDCRTQGAARAATTYRKLRHVPANSARPFMGSHTANLNTCGGLGEMDSS
ncbi:hypothetical protein J6590_039752 [Homalodisca vitripennis]|nr:hypothetical protein J6590_039752 [Homalodisca vitripennis]